MGGFLDTFKVIASPVTSAINAVTSLGSSLINRHSQKETNKSNQYLNDTNLSFNKEQNDLTRQFNAEEAEKARQFNAEQAQLQFDRSADFEREMWNLQNEYNTPAAQIQRLKDAGINPNMFSSDGNTAGSVGSATSSAASSSPASASALGAPNAIPKQPLTLANPAFEAAQIRLSNAEAKKAEQDANRTKELTPYEIETEKAKAYFENMQGDFTKEQKKLIEPQIQQIGASIDALQNEALNYKALANLNSESAEEKKRANELFDKTFDYVVAKCKAEYGLVLANIDSVKAQMRSFLAQAGMYASQAELNGVISDSYALPNFVNGLKLQWYDYKNKTARGREDLNAYFTKEFDTNMWNMTFNIGKSKVDSGYYNTINGSDFLKVNHYFFQEFAPALNQYWNNVGTAGRILMK